MIVGIAAVDKNWAIGKTDPITGKGSLLFKLKKDMEFFQTFTKKCGFVVFGENTYLSLPKRPLSDRKNIILCPENKEYDDCLCFHDFNKLLAFIKDKSKQGNTICICGGAMLYKSFLNYYDEIFINKVDADGEGEVFFPNLDKDKNFKLYSKFNTVEDSGYNTTLCIYKRVQ